MRYISKKNCVPTCTRTRTHGAISVLSCLHAERPREVDRRFRPWENGSMGGDTPWVKRRQPWGCGAWGGSTGRGTGAQTLAPAQARAQALPLPLPLPPAPGPGPAWVGSNPGQTVKPQLSPQGFRVYSVFSYSSTVKWFSLLPLLPLSHLKRGCCMYVCEIGARWQKWRWRRSRRWTSCGKAGAGTSAVAGTATLATPGGAGTGVAWPCPRPRGPAPPCIERS